MNDILFSIFAGIIQGLTEFLPVSSSGHLVLFHDFLKFNLPDDLSFDVILHLGTLTALIFFFRKEIWRLILAFLGSFIKWDVKNNNEQRLAWHLFLATMPAAIVGFFLESLIESVFRSSIVVAFSLIVIGVLLYFADSYFSKERSISQLGLNSSLIIGAAQAIALIPGVSRSGITIIAGLSQKLKRQDAAKFSFLLSMPIVFGAGLKKVIDLVSDNSGNIDYLILTLGFLSSAISGYLCIKYFLKFLQSHSLRIFSYYRIVLGIIILLLLYFK
jgi:undecaprenyl-diphosphatase